MFDVVQVSPRGWYVVNTETGHRSSKKPLGRKVALRQLHAIHNSVEGAGLFDWIKKGVSKVKAIVSGTPRLDYSPKIREFLGKVGGNTIDRLLVSSCPVS